MFRLVVAPGIDRSITHYDAPVTWDPYADSLHFSWVTTIIIGNCGFTIVPCRKTAIPPFETRARRGMPLETFAKVCNGAFDTR